MATSFDIDRKRRPMHHTGNNLTRRLDGAYGGKRALALLAWNALRAYTGAFDQYQSINWRRVARVIFICKGNICRSPFAERRLGAYGIPSASAGLDADPGQAANARAIKVARRLGVDLAAHRSTHVRELNLREGDLLVAFEPEHADRLHPLMSHQSGIQLTLLGLWSPTARLAYLHDPYGLSEAYFHTCFRRIDWGLQGLRSRCSSARKKENAP